MSAVLHRIPEQAARCLTCACDNSDNLAARVLLLRTHSRTAPEVIDALFESREDALELTEQARRAIAEQRDWCVHHGPFDREACTVEWIRAL